jgi:putative transposase
VDRCSYFR